MIKCLTYLAAFYLGGVAVLASYYATWLAVNPNLGPHWTTVQFILGWPFYRLIEFIAYCV
jgi:hypothetical protein